MSSVWLAGKIRIQQGNVARLWCLFNGGGEMKVGQWIITFFIGDLMKINVKVFFTSRKFYIAFSICV